MKNAILLEFSKFSFDMEHSRIFLRKMYMKSSKSNESICGNNAKQHSRTWKKQKKWNTYQMKENLQTNTGCTSILQLADTIEELERCPPIRNTRLLD